MTLSSFKPAANTAVIGAGGGLGEAFVDALSADPAIARVFALSRRQVAPRADVVGLTADVTEEPSLATAAAAVADTCDALDLVIVATGNLHGPGVAPEKTWRALDPAAMQQVFRVNTMGPALAAKHFLPLLRRDSKTVFAALSARVGSIADNRLGGWYAYRASKAALNQILKTLAIELARANPGAICVGLHPGTVATALSQPFQRGVPPEKLFAPQVAAGHLLSVIDGLDRAGSGQVLAWDRNRVPP